MTFCPAGFFACRPGKLEKPLCFWVAQANLTLFQFLAGEFRPLSFPGGGAWGLSTSPGLSGSLPRAEEKIAAASGLHASKNNSQIYFYLDPPLFQSKDGSKITLNWLLLGN